MTRTTDDRPGTTGSVPARTRSEEIGGAVPSRPRVRADDAPVVEPAGWEPRQRLVGFAVAAVGLLAVVAATVRSGVGLHTDDLRLSYQLIDLPDLAHDPLGSVWYLHTQPPLYNLVVGSVARWSPFPAVGTLFVLVMLAFVGAGLLLTDVLARWRVHPAVAGAISVVALANPNLLSTIWVASYEVPVALLVIGSLWWFQRTLQQPGLAPLVGLSATLTALALTRSLFHPGFVVLLVVLAAVARRARWRHVGVALAIPVVLIGGWMVKNQVLFGTPTLSSWLGFNLQRGVTAPMEKADVERDVAAGRVTTLARQFPWGPLTQYEPWLDGCRAEHRNPAVAKPVKFVQRGVPIPNFNHECYLPLYAESQENATTLVGRHPGRYLSSRAPVIVGSFSITTLDEQQPGPGDPGDGPSRTWMDAVADVALVPYEAHIDLRGWNLPLFGDALVPIRVSLTLAVLAVGIGLRGLLALWRLARSGWRDRATSWDTGELLWLEVTGTIVLVVLVGDLLEFGENGRFRSVIDPFLVAVPLAALARLTTAALARFRSRPGPGPEDQPAREPVPT